MPAPRPGAETSREGGIGGEGDGARSRGKIHLKSQTKASPAKCQSQHNSLCEPNYHNDVKEPNQQSGANLSCITGLSFEALHS